MNCQDYREIISAHIDGTLSDEEKLEVQSHLDQCPRCKQTLAWETNATNLLRRSLSPLTARPELKQRLLDRLSEADNRSLGWLSLSHAWAPAVSILLIIGIVYFVWPFRNQGDFFVDTVTHYQRAHQDLENFSDTAGTDPTARILDLKPWGYHLLGRRVHRVKGQENRVFFYHGQQNDLLVAQELEGQSFLPPRGSTVVKKSGRDFVSFTNGDLNLVAWQDKNMICVIASKLPKDHVVALAAQIAEPS